MITTIKSNKEEDIEKVCEALATALRRSIKVNGEFAFGIEKRIEDHTSVHDSFENLHDTGHRIINIQWMD